MENITKITFYGKDYIPISAAEVKDHTLADEIRGCGLTYGELLEQFVWDYKIPKKGDSLYFSADNTMFGGWVGVFRNKKFKCEVKKEVTQEEALQEEIIQKEFDISLEIRCRFDENKKAYFLAAMLLCLDLDDRKYENPDEVNFTFDQVMDIFLLFTYKKQLAEAVKKGIFRKYQRFENNDSRPHGTIDIARHIRENMGLKNGSIAYHYRELTANNPVNRLILAAYKRLCEKFPKLCERHIENDESVFSTLNMLQTELGYFKPNAGNIVKENLRPITHPYFSEYEDLRKICLKILRDENVSIFDAASSEETESLYVDVPWLWEQFVESHIRKLQEDFGMSLTTQGIDKEGKQIFVKRKDTDFVVEREEVAKPDFVLWKREPKVRAIAILDAKFKPRLNDFFCGGKDEFVDEDINKCIRDMVVFNARRTGVIFPFREGENDNDPYPEKDQKHHIGYSIGASDKVFDMVRVPVPTIPEEEDASFTDWYEALDLAVKGALKEYLSKVSGEEPADT